MISGWDISGVGWRLHGEEREGSKVRQVDRPTARRCLNVILSKTSTW